MAGNNLTNNGKDMSGLLKLVKILPLTKIERLACAAASRIRFCDSPYRLLIDTSSFADSLSNNVMCGVDENGDGTYSSEAIIELFEVLKGSSVTSLGCAA